MVYEDVGVAIAAISLAGVTHALDDGSLVLVWPGGGVISAPLRMRAAVFEWLVSVTGAYTGEYSQWYVDCADVATLPNFTLHLGADGATPVTIRPIDYVDYRVSGTIDLGAGVIPFAH